MKRIVIASFLALSACSTGYHSRGFGGTGFTEARMAEDMIQVEFNGNGWTSPQQARDMALLRSAEVTLKCGYKFFMVESMDRNDDVTQVDGPTNYQVTGQRGFAGTYNAQVNAGPTYHEQIVKPGVTLTVHMSQSRGYDARLVRSSMKRKYGIE